MIEFDQRICGDFAQAVSKEWLETNGLGGFASSTIIGCNTRRYHGLLVAALKPPSDRIVLLSKLEEELVVDGVTYPLSTNQYPGVLHPAGYIFQEGFRLEPFPTQVFHVGGVKLEKEIFMPHGLSAVVVNYRLLSLFKTATLRLRPMVAGCYYHHLNRRGSVSIEAAEKAGELLVLFGWGTQLHIYHEGDFSSAPEWFYNFEYERERERGLDFQEDLFSPGIITLSLSEKGTAIVASSTPLAPEPEKWRAAEISRREGLAKGADEEIRPLVEAADTFLVRRPQGLWDIIAGYHWFEAWGRDAMISLPGLCLEQGRLEVARGILLNYAKAAHEGLLPNRFADDDDTPHYNTVDAALWFVHVMDLLAAYPSEEDFVRQYLLPAAQEIVLRYSAGTRYGIHADEDGFLVTGEDGAQLTWMDAKVGEVVMTPRAGKPVEIQALWYNALRIMQKFGDGRWRKIAGNLQENFPKLFWNAAENCLYDCIASYGPDASIRPNQVLALSLTHPLLEGDMARRVLEVVERELLTPYGLRTLSPRDSRYRGRYEGDVWSRDSAYHQGTVWPWLIGPFVSAYLRVHGNTVETKARAREFLQPLLNHLADAGLGSISEILDGDPPHTPRGCISQAWSVAEFLRAWNATA